MTRLLMRTEGGDGSIRRNRSRPHRRAARMLLGFASAAVLLVAACGDDDDADEAEATDTSSPSLGGSTWALTSQTELGVTLGEVSVTARFDEGTLTGESGCNSYTTTYTTSSESLTIGPDIVTTRMACGPAETAVETAYLDRLPRAASYQIDGATLTLADDSGETLLTYEATVGAEAILGSWTVTSYYAGTAVTSVLGGATLTADFTAEQVTGETGCNSFNGPSTVDGDTITIGPLASTRAACPTEELQQQESDYLAALQLATSFQVTGDRLDLFRANGGYAATLERE